MNQGQEYIKEAGNRKALKNDYREVFLYTDAGKRVLLDLLQFAGVIRPVFVKGDPEQTAFNEGMRNLGLTILDLLDKRGYKEILDLEKSGVELLKLGDD